MSFLDDVENELRSIVGGEFSTSFEFMLGSDSMTVNGIFDKTYLTVDNDGNQIMSNNSQCGVFIKDIEDTLGEINVDDLPIAIINNTEYLVTNIERDGTGYARLILKINQE